jgi:Protein of unknown function (DUF1800)
MTDHADDPRSLDPEAAWRPWQPDARRPWNLQWAGHLYRRAGFGASWDELHEAVRAGLPATLDRLFAGGPGLAEFDALLDTVGPENPDYYFGPSRDSTGGLAAWWLHRLLYSPHPLREKITLFWHGHFATSVAKVRSPVLMKRQHLLLRQHALGPFGPFAQAISRDPAMLVYLDSNSNVKAHPNENYARELFELFTLGTGHYTEKDIRESARAFTGWHTTAPTPVPRPNVPPAASAEFNFRASEHDDGEKTVLGRTGKWDGGDIVRFALEQPACAQFLVRKLYRFYVSEDSAPSDALLEPLADRYRRSGYDTADLLRTILLSEYFYSAAAFRRRVKSPVEYAVGLVRTLQAAPAYDGPLFGAEVLEATGQVLFAPPNVKGWDGGKAWLNSATLLARQNLAWHLVQGPGSPLAARTQLVPLAQRHAGADPAKQVEFVLDMLLQPAPGEVAEAARSLLVADLTTLGASRDQRLREAAHTVMLMPLFQLA